MRMKTPYFLTPFLCLGPPHRGLRAEAAAPVVAPARGGAAALGAAVAPAVALAPEAAEVHEARGAQKGLAPRNMFGRTWTAEARKTLA